jgi:hypothetical protein
MHEILIPKVDDSASYLDIDTGLFAYADRAATAANDPAFVALCFDTVSWPEEWR